jgi:hypothetical protein
MEDWQPDQSETIQGDCVSWCTAHLWIVPAQVQGTWQAGSNTLTLKQTFQNVEGTLGSTAISGGKLRGDELTFSVGNTKYTGKVNGSSISGSMSGGASGSWSATKK